MVGVKATICQTFETEMKESSVRRCRRSKRTSIYRTYEHALERRRPSTYLLLQTVHVTKVCGGLLMKNERETTVILKRNSRSLARRRCEFVLADSGIFAEKTVSNVSKASKATLTCLQRLHWNASVSACTSSAPSVLNRFSSRILLSADLRSSDAISWLDIVQNRATSRSPATMLSRKLGLFLSFKLTYSERILALYAAVTPLLSAWIVASMPFAFDKICSDAEGGTHGSALS